MKLDFSVCFASGEDVEYPADELNHHSPHTKGWQCPRFADYPQEIGIELNQRARLSQVQLLSHQSKIATRIELFVGDGDESSGYGEMSWTRLGYLSLDSNERSKYQARELKSVYIDASGKFLKLLVHRCFINRHNLFNQVGVVAVNLLGEFVPDGGGGGGGGSGAITMGASGSGGGGGGSAKQLGPMDDISFEMNLDPESAQRIREIVAAKEAAVAAEDYDLAKRLKVAEQQLRQMGGQLAQLEIAKRQAVQSEDYDRAKILKSEIGKMRHMIEDKLNSHGDGGGGGGRDQGGDQGGDRGGFRGQNVMAASGGDRRGHHPAPASPTPSMGGGRDERDDGPPMGGGGGPPRGGHDMGGGAAAPPMPMSAEAHPMGARAGSPMNFDEDAPLPASRSRSQQGDRGADSRFADEHPPQQTMGEAPGPSSVPSPADPGRAPKARRPIGADAADEHPPAAGGKASWSGDGPHPLEGVANYQELPEPEPARASASEGNELNGVEQLFGEYLMRCLVSKSWQLRDAAIQKIRMRIGELEGSVGMQDASTSLCYVMRVGAEDKIAQAFITSLTLIEECCRAFTVARVKRATLIPLLDPTCTMLITKLGDNQPRVRDAAFDTLVVMAKAKCVGPAVIAAVVLRKMAKKDLTRSKWRPLATRLQLLKQLVDEFSGKADVNGLGPDALLGWVKSHECATHNFEQVRDAARELAVALYKSNGMEVDTYVSEQLGLRPKQLEEYQEAFRIIDGGAAPAERDAGGEQAPAPRGRGRGASGGGGGGGQSPSQPRGRGRGRRKDGAAAASGPSPREEKAVATVPEGDEFDDADGDEDDGPVDPLEEAFRDSIMKQLEEEAFSVEEAHNILRRHFGPKGGDPVKDAVLAEWCHEVGLEVAEGESLTSEQRDTVLKEVSSWLFQ